MRGVAVALTRKAVSTIDTTGTKSPLLLTPAPCPETISGLFSFLFVFRRFSGLRVGFSGVFPFFLLTQSTVQCSSVGCMAKPCRSFNLQKRFFFCNYTASMHGRSAARHYGIPEPSWPVSLQHGTDYFLPYIALIAIRLGDSLDVHAAHQYYQVLYLIIVTSRQILNMPMVNKQLSMWSESMSTLLMVHHYGRPTHALTELRRRLRRLRIHPNMYTFTHFLQPNAVYWKQRVELRPDLPRSVNPQSDVYIGSTSITYPSREHNRRAKLLGIQHGQFINAEPGIILATMTSLLHGLSSQTPTIPSPGPRNTP